MYISKVLPRRSVVKDDRREEREELADVVRGRGTRVHWLALRKRGGGGGEEESREKRRRQGEVMRKKRGWSKGGSIFALCTTDPYGS